MVSQILEYLKSLHIDYLNFYYKINFLLDFNKRFLEKLFF